MLAFLLSGAPRLVGLLSFCQRETRSVRSDVQAVNEAHKFGRPRRDKLRSCLSSRFHINILRVG
jgi:hypothetical protein